MQILRGPDVHKKAYGATLLFKKHILRKKTYLLIILKDITWELHFIFLLVNIFAEYCGKGLT